MANSSNVVAAFALGAVVTAIAFARPEAITVAALPSAAIDVASSPAQGTRTPARIVSTGDGDTLRARVGSQTITVRMVCIDAPEIAQPQGPQSAERLRQLLPRESAVELRIVETDRYGRKVAEVYRNGQSVNLQMVQEGRAVVYTQYLDGCATTRDRYLQIESQARQRRLGFWSQSNPIMPWDWRQGTRPAAPAPAATPRPTNRPAANNCDPSYPDFCIPPNAADLDCGDISQRRFRVLPPDPHGFDRDRDGVGCES